MIKRVFSETTQKTCSWQQHRHITIALDNDAMMPLSFTQYITNYNKQLQLNQSIGGDLKYLSFTSPAVTGQIRQIRQKPRSCGARRAVVSTRYQPHRYGSAPLMCCRSPRSATSGFTLTRTSPCGRTWLPPCDRASQRFDSYVACGDVCHNKPCWH